VFLLLTAIFPLLSCTGSDDDELNLDGEYTYGECVYLSYLSSSTIEYKTETNEGLVYLDFQEELLTIYTLDAVIFEGGNPSYKKEDPSKNIDDTVNLEIGQFLGSISNRYDIYSDEEYSGYTIFTSDSNLYLAKIQVLTENSHCIVWEIFEILI